MTACVICLALLCQSFAVLAGLSVTDDAGRIVTLAQPAGRIVALSPHATELLFAAGAGSQVVGVSGFSDYPPSASQLPRVGDGAGLDLERIVALQPDLVVAWPSGSTPARLERLEQLGIPLFFSEPGTPESIASSLERLGVLAGRETRARTAAAEFRRGVAALHKRYHDRSPVRVFYQVWGRPLMTINGEHVISAWMRLCGAHNVFADVASLAPAISREAVIAAQPEVMVAGRYAGKSRDWKAAWQRWTSIPAVAAGHLFTVSAELLERQTPRALQGAVELCAKIDQVR